MLRSAHTKAPVFVIAKVAGRYRNLGGLEQSFIYGLPVAERCLRLLKIFQQLENRIPIQQELLVAQDKSEAFWSSKPECPLCHGCSFPYLATCLLLGATFIPSDGCVEPASLISFDKEFDEGEKMDAVTIIDISEPRNVRYCFVRYNPYSLPVPLMTPLSAATFLFDSYYDLDDEDGENEGYEEEDDIESEEEWVGESDEDEDYYEGAHEEDREEEEDSEDEPGNENVKESGEDALSPVDRAKLVVDGFEGRALVSADSLNCIWPRDGWKGLRKEPRQPNLSPDSPSRVTSLKAMAMDKLIQNALTDSEFDISWLAELGALYEDFLPGLRNWLYQHSDGLELSSVNFRVMIKAFEDVPDSRLGIFQKFTLEDLLMIVSGLQEKKQLSTLNLSGSKSIDPASLRSILQITPGLHTLYLMGSLNLPLQSVLSVLEEAHINVPNLYHSELFKLFLQHREAHTGSPGSKDFALKFPNGASTKSPAIQILWVFTCASELDAYNLKGVMDWDLFTSDTKAKRKCSDLSSYDSPGVNYGRFSLKHSLLSPARLVTGMSQFAEFSLNNKSWNRYDYKTYLQALASSFAMAPSTVDGSEFQVGPVPLMVDVNPHCPEVGRKSHAPEDLFSTIKPGDWTLMVLHEHVYYKNFSLEDDPIDLPQKWRYAFVNTRQASTSGMSEDTDLVVADMSTFLATTAGDEAQELDEYWKKVRANLNGVEPCDEEAVKSLWRGFFCEEAMID